MASSARSPVAAMIPPGHPAALALERGGLDAAGDLVYTKPGGYASEAALEDDVREYSVRGARAGQ